jgi:hypothetical protein
MLDDGGTIKIGNTTMTVRFVSQDEGGGAQWGANGGANGV